jgi:hypothetical protein
MREDTRNRPINLFYLAVLFIVIYLGIDFVINLLLADQQQRIIYSDIVSPIIGFLTCGTLLFAAKQSFNHSKRLGIAWGIIALSALAFALGDTTWAILELGLKEPPFPSLADAFYLAY